MPRPGRDRLRELLDAVLAGADDGVARTLDEMAGDAFASPFHFSRLLSRDTGEPPVAMRRRVMLERAAWQLRQGSSVTDAAWAAGYESVDGFSRAFARAFGHPPETPARGHWLPTPNGIHYHPPMALWVSSPERVASPVTEQLVGHDLADTRALLAVALELPEERLRDVRLPGVAVLDRDGPEESIAAVLEHLVRTREVWLAAIEGLDAPPARPGTGVAGLLGRHDAAAGRWLAAVRDLDRRGAWNDRLIDSRRDPPETFLLSGVVAHVLTYSAHRRQLARGLLRAAGRRIDDGDPITWLRARRGETTGEDGA